MEKGDFNSTQMLVEIYKSSDWKDNNGIVSTFEAILEEGSVESFFLCQGRKN